MYIELSKLHIYNVDGMKTITLYIIADQFSTLYLKKENKNKKNYCKGNFFIRLKK